MSAIDDLKARHDAMMRGSYPVMCRKSLMPALELAGGAITVAADAIAEIERLERERDALDADLTAARTHVNTLTLQVKAVESAADAYKALLDCAEAENARLRAEVRIGMEVISDQAAIIRKLTDKGTNMKTNGQVMYEGYANSAGDYSNVERYRTWAELPEDVKQVFDQTADLADFHKYLVGGGTQTGIAVCSACSNPCEYASPHDRCCLCSGTEVVCGTCKQRSQ